MKIHRFIFKFSVAAIAVFGTTLASANQTTFKPSEEPVFSTPRAKPNIHMVLDDSASMKNNSDITLGGKKVKRTEALDYTYKALMNKYKDKAYLGVSFLWQTYDAGTRSPSVGTGLVRLPIDDYSKKTAAEFERDVIKPISASILNSPGNTPMYPGIYEAIKMYRGQPITANGLNAPNPNRNSFFSGFPRVELFDTKEWQQTGKGQGNGNRKEVVVSSHYPAVKHPSPVRFRCQQNHMIVMTDGEPNDVRVWGIDENDGLNIKSSVNNSLQLKDGSVNLSSYTDITSSAVLGELAANIDLRDYQTGLDEAGKPWKDPNDKYSVKMPIYMHTVSLFVNPKSQIYTGLTDAINRKFRQENNTTESVGMNLGFEKNGSTEDLLQAFDTIFASIILSTSSTRSMNDRIHSDLLEGPPVVKADGSVDLKTLGTIRYDTVYDFRPRFGSVRAMVPYIAGYDSSQKDPTRTGHKGKPLIESFELWNTDTSITPNQGRYVTYLQVKDKDAGLNLYELKNSLVLSEFQKIRSNMTSNDIDWLTNFRKTDNLGDLRGRLNPLGSITNSEIITVNKDVLNLSLDSEKISPSLKNDLTNWLLFKAKHQPNNLLVVADNDGFISFIKAQRGLSKGHRGGERDTAYFPKMLVHRFDEIAKANRNATLVLEGKTDLVDAKVYQPSQNGGEHVYATIGLTSMGGGGKGIVGYRIYADKAETIENWAKNKATTVTANANNIYNKVTPLFEITNEGPNKTYGFEDLGYTYSGFEFFNRIQNIDNTERGQAVAVFGNGFGTEKSVVYFVDAYTGQKLHQIILDPHGKGAATPSIVVSRDGEGGQKIDRLYVGDYSGSLYKVEFTGRDFTASNTRVTKLFKAPETNFGQSAISVKPLVVKNKNSGVYQIFVGTGLASSLDLDRYENSWVTHALYGITDDSSKQLEGSQKLTGDLEKTLVPLFTIENLKEGRVKYKENEVPNYEKVDRYNVTTYFPVANPNEGVVNGNNNGWYIVLSADNNNDMSLPGEKGSGERVIYDPQYDSYHDAVVFSTWGIKERGGKPDKTTREDPCVSDLAFGKVLSFYTKTGGGSYKIGIANKATTGKAEGTITGDGIKAAPEGNEETELADLSLDVQKLLLATVDVDNSAYERDLKKLGTYCVGGLDGQVHCSEIERSEKDLGTDPVRISIHERYNF